MVSVGCCYNRKERERERNGIATNLQPTGAREPFFFLIPCFLSSQGPAVCAPGWGLARYCPEGWSEDCAETVKAVFCCAARARHRWLAYDARKVRERERKYIY